MERSFQVEWMEDPALPESVLRTVHRDLTRMHRWLGNTAAIVRALRRDPLPVRRVLDVGCGDGGVLADIRRRLNVEVLGVDVRPPPDSVVPIVACDAACDPLPQADVAIAVCFVHHLSEEEFDAVIRNVGRSCRRFIVLDLVRSRLPRELFRWFVAPWVNPVNANDGCVSVERAYTPREMRLVVQRALAGTGARFRHSVAPLYARQIVDIVY